MNLSHADKLAGMYARDRRLDGRYIVAVLSTRIYCLPSCPARKPLAENVRFVASPDAARRAGFRACLRCRPDDFHAGVDRTTQRLAAAVAQTRAHPAEVDGVADLAGRAGCGPTRLTELTRTHYHLTPATLLARARVDHAASALAAGAAVAAAGYDAGFDSTTAYYQNFRRYHGLSPGDFRALGERIPRRGEAGFVLRLPEGFAPAPLYQLMSRDASHASERVDAARAGERGRCVYKAIGDPSGRAAVIAIRIAGREAHVGVHPADQARPDRDLMRHAHRVAVRLLGYASESATLRKRLKPGDRLAALLGRQPGLRVPLMASAWEALVWALLGQQVNLTFASALRASLIRLANGTADDDTSGSGLLPHPSPAQVAALDPRELQAHRFSKAKSQWLVDISGAIARGELDLLSLSGGPVGDLKSALIAHKGVGDWTAEYVMLRGMGLNDCIPAADVGLARAVQQTLALEQRPDAAGIHALLAPYSPCRSLVCQHLWASLAPATPRHDAPGGAAPTGDNSPSGVRERIVARAADPATRNEDDRHEHSD
jgi:AraC family transcriptional regulator of adaptative response / DNA-3-methyladenine glycosylase II